MFKKMIIATLALTSVAFAADKIEIDPAASKVVYLAKKVTGEHTGDVKIASGNLVFEKGVLKGGEFVADMTTIANTDIADKEYHKKFIDHMISDDFFGVTTYKTASFVIKNVTKKKGDQYKVTGDLTIKGKTAPVSFDATATKDLATAKLTFDRTKYDIKYGSGKFFQGLGDKMINDEVQLDVTLTAKK
ncbi:MAG: YceI family protein [Bacteriovorax sp.]|jgi:polyisoprenoid-binding protein YceI